MRHSRFWFVTGVLLAGLTLSGASSAAAAKSSGKSSASGQKSADKPQPEAPPPEKKLGPAPDKATNAKVNSYIEILNKETEGFNTLREEWLTKIDPQKGPTCKEDIGLVHTIAADASRLISYRQYIKAKPKLSPDEGVSQMVEALQDLQNMGGEPGPYTEYQGRSQPGAWCKKLKDAYPRMLAIFDKYTHGERQLRAYVENFTDERDQREVQSTLKKYGKHYRYQFANLVLEGKTMMRTVGGQLRNKAPDTALIKQRFDSFFAITDETQAMMAAEKPNQKADPYPDVFKFFLNESVPGIKRASADLLEALALAPGKKRDERLDRAWKSVVSSYNNMIDYANQVHFDAKQK